MTTAHFAPLQSAERATILDMLRGFALLGVLLDNLFAFTGWGFITDAQRAAIPTAKADGILAALELVLVHGKFYSIFSLLFGIGFAVILIRNEQRGTSPFKIFYRRLFILLLIGIIHVRLLWEGDILLLYALAGMLLPLFRKCTDKALLVWAIALILSPLLIDGIKVLLDTRTGAWLESYAYPTDAKNGIDPSNFGQYLSQNGAGWNEWRNWQETGYIYRYAYIIESNRIPKVLGLFLLGFYAGRKMMYAKLHHYRPLFRKLCMWGFIIGIPFNIAMAVFELDHRNVPHPKGLLDTVCYAVGVVPLSIAYVSAFCLYWSKRNGNTRWKLLAPVGRMALTNYLSQTIFGILIFYGLGLGLGGDIGPAFFFPIGLGIYLFQIIVSNIWMKYFNYGPLEWIWRMMTYGKWLKIRTSK